MRSCASSPLPAAAFVLTAALGACSPTPPAAERACTMMGCESGLAVDVDGTPQGAYRVEVQAAGQPPRAQDCPASPGCSGIFFADLIADEVTVAVIAGAERSSRTVRPRYSTVEPNGAGCPPTCRQARVAVPWPAGAGAAAHDPAAAPADDWTAGIVEVHRPAAGIAVLDGVRAARHEGFDRVVFELSPALPGYRVEYVDRPVRSCGSGEVVPLPGDAWLAVQLEPAAAHTEAGSPTVGREVPAALGNARRLVLTCDFEAVVTWVLAVGSPNRYRVSTLDSPPRLVVDVRH